MNKKYVAFLRTDEKGVPTSPRVIEVQDMHSHGIGSNQAVIEYSDEAPIQVLAKGNLTEADIQQAEKLVAILVERHKELFESQLTPIGEASYPAARPVRNPWYQGFFDPFYLGIGFVFACFGAVTSLVLTTGWLFRLIKVCF